MEKLSLRFDVCVPSEYSAGIRGFNDTIRVVVDSGDPGGDNGEFAEFIRQSLSEWYDGGKVKLIS